MPAESDEVDRRTRFVHPAGVRRPRAVFAEKLATKAGVAQTEIFPLTMFALGGMMLFPACNDLLTMFIALEVFSLPLYLMCGLARRRRLLSQEASLKYFLLGAFSSAFFLYGIALLYGYSGGLSLQSIADAVAADSGNTSLALIGVGLLSVGVLFKVGAVPFHSWIPDVYQGAPTPVTAFMAAATKIAAFGAMLRIFYVGLPGLAHDWRPLMWAIAILTMAVGTVTAVSQTDVKRMLGYSSVAHAGFILTGVIALNESWAVGDVVLFVRLRFQHARCVRRRQRGPQRRRRRGDRHDALGGPRPPPPLGRRGVLAVPARVRGHPA